MQKILRIVSYMVLLTILVNCQGNKNPCSLSDVVLADINKIDSLIGVPEVQNRDKDWMKYNYSEPSVFQADNEIYRFIWSSSFDGTKIYRVERKANTCKAIVKIFGQGDTVGKFTEFNISKEVWNNITDSLNAINFWMYPSSIDRKGLDGESWSFEGYKPIKDKCTQKKYHKVERWSPIDTPFISMCKLLSNLNK